MKKVLLGVLFLVLILVPALSMAWTATWEVEGEFDKCVLHYRVLGAPSWIDVDVGVEKMYVLDPLNLVKGTRYEFYVHAELQGMESGPSNLLRWTMPEDPQVIEAPSIKSLTITFGP